MGGNNILMAQKKFMEPDDGTCKLRDLSTNPGIFMNGGLVQGPGGKWIESHALGKLYLHGQPDERDFVTALLDFFDDQGNKASLLTEVGLVFLTANLAAGYESA